MKRRYDDHDRNYNSRLNNFDYEKNKGEAESSRSGSFRGKDLNSSERTQNLVKNQLENDGGKILEAPSNDHLKSRQERLALWKQKNSAKKKESPTGGLKQAAESVSIEKVDTDVEDKMLKRQKKLEEWKKKKLEQQSKLEVTSKSSFAPRTIKTKLTAFKKPLHKNGLVKTIVRQSMFGDDDEENSKAETEKKKFVPLTERSVTTKVVNNNQDNDQDELEEYLSSLTKESLPDGKEATFSGSIVEEDESDMLPEVNEDVEEIDKKSNELITKLQNKNKKILDKVDHSKIDYELFRKDFYTEPPELRSYTQEEVDNLRLLLDGIKVRGQNCPKPIFKWSHLGLPSQTVSVIEELGYIQPSSIQSQSMPAIMAGRDVIGVAKTGSGKTLSFLLPMFRHIKDQRPLSKNEGPISLIITPTRELAMQIYKESKPFLKALSLRGVCAYGGSPIKEQISDLKKGAELLVCTPGRMIDLLSANQGRVTNLKRVTYLVLDEADRMFDMGFEPQVMKIINNVRPDRQTVLFSATFPSKMESLAKKVLNKPIEIIVGARSVVGSDIKQIIEIVSEEEKFLKLLNNLGTFTNSDPEGKVLIFVDKQVSADDLFMRLIGRGYASFAIHGAKDQMDRQSAIQDFKDGVVNILIATSVAARGLDVKGLRLVINYDAPNHMEDYVHRVGRTGRAGTKGTAITFVRKDQERAIADLTKALKMSKVEVPVELSEINEKFMEKVKQGKEKFNFGFGGKGLEKLEEIRTTNRNLERKAYGEEVEEENTPASSSNNSNNIQLNDKELKDFEVVFGTAPNSSGPDNSLFHATINVNDLPQKARWIVTNKDNLSKVIELSSTSITNKGIYYPVGKKPGDNEPPKLYLLVEGDNELSVKTAVNLLKQSMIDGLEISAREDARAPTGKYSI